MKKLARVSLFLIIILVVVSAYLRLHASGIGCPDWPACYGNIGQIESKEPVDLAQSAYQRIVAESDAPLAWAAPLHRLVASVLGLAILFLTGLSFKTRRHRVLCTTLLALTVFLALIGIRSGSLHYPAIVMGNLLGGFAMLGLLGWLAFQQESGAPRFTETRIAHLRPLVITALVMLCFQITLGGLTSANFAGTVCTTVPDCNGLWFPDATVYTAFQINTAREVTPEGMAVGGLERVSIHLAHRLFAVLTSLAIIAAAVAGILAISETKKMAIFALLILLLEFSVGVASVIMGLPIGLALAHNWLAGLLLLVLLKMLAVSRERWVPPHSN